MGNAARIRGRITGAVVLACAGCVDKWDALGPSMAPDAAGMCSAGTATSIRALRCRPSPRPAVEIRVDPRMALILGYQKHRTRQRTTAGDVCLLGYLHKSLSRCCGMFR